MLFNGQPTPPHACDGVCMPARGMRVHPGLFGTPCCIAGWHIALIWNKRLACRYRWADRFDIALLSHKKVRLTDHHSDEYNFDGPPHGNEQSVFSEDERFWHNRRAQRVSTLLIHASKAENEKNAIAALIIGVPAL